ncbi:hypothetical protein D3C79_1072610 [compost metagenome]
MSTCGITQMPEQLWFNLGNTQPRSRLLKIDDKANRIPVAPTLIVSQLYATNGNAA